eukprot:scaffold967_cov321-Pavlova_lutheri.AAC.39
MNGHTMGKACVSTCERHVGRSQSDRKLERTGTSASTRQSGSSCMYLLLRERLDPNSSGFLPMLDQQQWQMDGGAADAPAAMADGWRCCCCTSSNDRWMEVLL